MTFFLVDLLSLGSSGPLEVEERKDQGLSEFISFCYWTSPPAVPDRRVFPLMTDERVYLYSYDSAEEFRPTSNGT